MRAISKQSILSLLLMSLPIAMGCAEGTSSGSNGTSRQTGGGGEAGMAGSGGQGADGGAGGSAGNGGAGGDAGSGNGGAAGSGAGGGGGASCGDHVLDTNTSPAEECDDGNNNNGDCCTADCKIEAGCEREPNGTSTTGNSFFDIGIGGKVKAIASGSNDLDWFSFSVPNDKKARIVAETVDGFASSCAQYAIVTELLLTDAQGVVLANGVDSGVGFCSKLSYGPLDPGTYYIESRSTGSATGEFDYGLTLGVTLYSCGDGQVDKIVGEECDDGNVSNGDGCDSKCTVELGFTCSAAPSKCTSGCNDGLVEGNEECDDGNNVPNDGCSPICTVEPGYLCNGGGCVSICGDGIRAIGNEDCDDGNNISGDCCDASCQFESGCERETNDAKGEENDYSQLAAGGMIKGLINPPKDADRFFISVPAGGIGTIVAETHDGTKSTCAALNLDSYLEILDPSGIVIAHDDDSGVPYCSKVMKSGLAPGKYTVRLIASPVSSNATFDYSLSIDKFVCGNGMVESNEQCDDGNLASGDGCDGSCLVEGLKETESNNDATTANGPYSASDIIGGAIVPATDVDYYAITIPKVVDLSIQTYDVYGPGTCAGIDTVLSFVAPDGTTIWATDDDNGINACSLLGATNAPKLQQLAPGTYYARVESLNHLSTINGYKLAIDFTAVCGNGVIEGFEQCDGGANCDASCKTIALCGDGVIENGESCDDGNTTSGDGCSASCQLEGADVEPNNTLADADARALDATPVLVKGDAVLSGSIGNLIDRDTFKMSLSSNSVVRLETFDASGVDCLNEELTVRLFKANGVEIVTDAQSGIQSCGAITMALPMGTYYVQVEETGMDTANIDYRLQVKIEANSGIESEPNDDAMTAGIMPGTDVFVLGHQQPIGETDYYKITVPPGKSLRAEIIEGEYAPCESNLIESALVLFDDTSQILAYDIDSGRGVCSLIDGTGSVPLHSPAHGLAGGTYYLAVMLSPNASSSPLEFAYRLVVTMR